MGALLSLRSGSLLIPLDGYRFVVARELLATKPELKHQVCRLYDDSYVELTDVKGAATTKARAPLVLLYQLVLMHARQVTRNIAELDRSRCDTLSVSSSNALRAPNSHFFMLLGRNCGSV